MEKYNIGDVVEHEEINLLTNKSFYCIMEITGNIQFTNENDKFEYFYYGPYYPIKILYIKGDIRKSRYNRWYFEQEIKDMYEKTKKLNSKTAKLLYG